MATTPPPDSELTPSPVVGQAYVKKIVYNIPAGSQLTSVSASSGLPSGLAPRITTETNLVIEGTPTTTTSLREFFLTTTVRNSDGSNTTSTNRYFIRVNAVCVAADTEILMADGTIKQIQEIRRGDLVATDNSLTSHLKVARTLKTVHQPDHLLNICHFEPNSLSTNVPYRKLVISFLHPILDIHRRRHAYRYRGTPGVHLYDSETVSTVVPLDKEGQYSLWDLQFETVGSYVANGMTIQSRHPQSFLTPLPRDLYFDQSLYDENLKNDHDSSYSLPLES